MCLSVLLARLHGLFKYRMELHHPGSAECKPEPLPARLEAGLIHMIAMLLPSQHSGIYLM